MFVNRQIVNIWYIPRNEKLGKSDDVLSAAEIYIEQNGPEAFEKLISKSTKSSKSRNTKRLNLEDGEAENRAKAERESWGENPFYDKNYRY
ncbi:HVA22-like protein a [Zea mays]|uniref:HVA22-like protein a n=1 Tax=Zea mays TaxID=4577 RepID=A0A3L6EB16_MAIZE|nr:HVA22-like protein a [Zea mays]